jgi:hypothetical protein
MQKGEMHENSNNRDLLFMEAVAPFDFIDFSFASFTPVRFPSFNESILSL